MKKKIVTVGLLEEHILPTLEAKHGNDAVAIQKAITDGFDVVSDDDPEVVVDFRYKAAKADPSPDNSVANIEAMTKAITKAMTDASKGFVPVADPDSIRVGNTDGIPAGSKMYASVKSFSGNEQERKFKAFRFGAWFLGTTGNTKHAEWCKSNGVPIVKAQQEGSNTAGGFLVPEVIENDIIVLRERYGVFRRSARVRPMTRDTLNVPRRTSGVTAYFTAENTAITESEKAWDSVQLTAKKLAALVKCSSEILEDAIINVGDDIADEIVYAFSLKEDQCGFTGDGTSTYGGIEGANVKIKRIWAATSADTAGVKVATGNLMSEVVLADFHKVVGALPQYAVGPNTKWFTSRFIWANVMDKIARAAGGVTAAEVRGPGNETFMGYPVEISQVFPTTDANSQILALFGDMRLAASFGDRRQSSVRVLPERFADADQIGIMGTQRFDINCHDVGDGTTAGPIVALQSLNA